MRVAQNISTHVSSLPEFSLFLWEERLFLLSILCSSNGKKFWRNLVYSFLFGNKKTKTNPNCLFDTNLTEIIPLYWTVQNAFHGKLKFSDRNQSQKKVRRNMDSFFTEYFINWKQKAINLKSILHFPYLFSQSNYVKFNCWTLFISELNSRSTLK